MPAQKRGLTIWKSLPKIDFETSMLERYFCQNTTSNAKRIRKGEIKEDRFQRIRVLDEKKSRQIAIMLKKFPPLEEISSSFWNCDLSVLTLERVSMMLQHIPSSGEINLIIKVSDLENLDYPEKYLLLIQGIPLFEKKLLALRVILSFDEEVEFLLTASDSLLFALREIVSSSELQVFFAIILSLGNWMNAGTSRERSDGFNLEILRTLKDIKSTNGSFSLMDFVVFVYEQGIGKHRSALVSQFLYLTSACQGMTLADIQTQIVSLISSFSHLSEIVEEGELDDDPFLSIIEIFVARVSGTVERLKTVYKQLDQAFYEAISYFGTSSFTLEGSGSIDFLTVFFHFLHDVQHSKPIPFLLPSITNRHRESVYERRNHVSSDEPR